MPKLDIYQSSDITSLQAERDNLRTTLRDTIATLDRAVNALAVHDKREAGMFTGLIEKARKVLNAKESSREL